MTRAEYMRQMGIVRDTLDKLERNLASACGLPPEAQRIIEGMVSDVRLELDQADRNVGIRPAQKAVN